MRRIELLAPAKNADVGIEAINHGADAVYIGAPQFSARAAAGNSVADIERLATYAHRYGAKAIVALNTLLTDAELRSAERMAWQLYEAGVDALIIQDLGLLATHLPSIPLHASTQTDNRTVEKVRLLRQLGMQRVVLARELALDDIRAIHEAVDVELECFIHGALCVSLSGQCYLSEALTGRSANRGACAQPCRLPMDLLDATGRVIVQQKHLLSLRDMNRSANLEALIEAGVTSLKIEGRLKDVAYVKNVTAWYRKKLDALLEQHEDWHAASDGRATFFFDPSPDKSFNRGFTDYYIKGMRTTREKSDAEPIWNFDTPKSLGEHVGVVERVGRDSFTVRTTSELHNGDGLMAGQVGFRLNRYDVPTNTVWPLGGAKVTSQLRRGMTLWRNQDEAFERLLSRPSAERRIGLRLRFEASLSSLRLEACDETGMTAEAVVMPPEAFAAAEKPQRENYRRQLTKLGDSLFALEGWTEEVVGDEPFIPSSQLADLRRKVLAKLMERRQSREASRRHAFVAPDYQKAALRLSASAVIPTDARANVFNQKTLALLRQMGLSDVAPAFELQHTSAIPLMETRHCLKYAMGKCPRYPLPKGCRRPSPDEAFPEPWTVRIGHKKFILKFGCQNDCMSKLFAIFAPEK